MEAVDLLARLVAFPTVSDRPTAPLVAYLSQRLEDLGFHVWTLDDPSQPGKCNLLASAGPTGTDGLILSGHMDVVPTEGQPWRTDPFELTQVGGRLYGRGTADMKGFIAATLCALHTLDVRRFERELLLIWTYDEEVGCLGSAHLVSDLTFRDRPVPSACLIGEPTDFRVMRMHSGHHVVEVRVEGTAAHSSRPDLGCNAIVGAAHVVRTIEELAADLVGQPHDIPEMSHPIVAVNVGNIRGGRAINIVPDHCRVQVGYRPLPGMDKHEFAQELTTRLTQLRGPWKVTTTLQHGIDSMLTPAGTDLERLLLPHASEPTAGAAGFATDGGNLAKLDTHPLVFGPGSIDVAHKANEYVEVAAVDRAVQVLRAVIHARCVTR